MKKLILGVFLALAAVVAYAQDFKYPPRMRVIIDNDFAGDPDGLVALAHHLLSPSVDVRGVISSYSDTHLYRPRHSAYVRRYGGKAANDL